MFTHLSQFVLRAGAVGLLHLLLLLPAHAQQANEGEQYRSARGQYFEIVGLDQASVTTVNQLAERIAQTCRRYLQRLEQSYPQPIFVALRPADATESGVHYVVRIGEAGFARVDFRWSEQLDLETVCLGLTEAFIKRYSYSHYGADAPVNLKYWPVSALASQAYLSLRPAQIENYLAEVRRTGLPAVNALLTLPYDEARQLGSGREGYWLLRNLKAEGRDTKSIRRVVEQAVAGLDTSRALEQLVQPSQIEAPALTVEAWWELRMHAVLSEDQELFEAMDVSLQWLERLVDFEAYRAEGHEFGNLSDLWDLREEATLREILTARRELIRLRLARVNPVYYNAARSLGVLYETALESRRKHEFIFALTAYLGDFEDMKRLHQKTREVLDAQ